MSKNVNKNMPDPSSYQAGDLILFKNPDRPTEMVPFGEVFNTDIVLRHFVEGVPTQECKPILVQRYCEPGLRTPERNPAFMLDTRVLMATLMAWKRRKPLAITGDPGTGKSEALEQVFAALNCEAVIVQLTEETEVADLLGEKGLDVKEGATCSVYVDGPVTEAFRKGLPVVFNELDYPRPGVITEANTFLRSNFLTLKNNGGEYVRRGVDSMFFGTLNTTGMADLDGLFAGTQPQNAATMQRWRWVKVGYPTPEKEGEILNKAVPELGMVDPSLTEALVKFAGYLRVMYQQKSIPLPYGVRSTVDAAEIMVDYGDPREAVRQTILDRISDDIQVEAIQKAFRDAFTMDW